MSDIVERLRTVARGDHDRACQGREYHCGCGFDEQAWKAADEAADLIEAMTAELAEARDKALDEAVEVADHHREKWGNAGGFESQAVGARIITQAIRALKSPKPQED